MPCLDPLTIRNPRYMPSLKNGGVPEICPDPRLIYIQVPCERCFECRRRKALHWVLRLRQEFRHYGPDNAHFVTFTFSDSSLDDIRNGYWSRGRFIVGIGSDATDNDVAKVAVRRFLERYRKEYGVSLRHFFVTELGGKNDRIHLHGVIFGCKSGFRYRGKYRVDIPLLTSLWSYGFVWLGWCTDATISYITKYILKTDLNHPDFRGKILCSPGIGRCYIDPSILKHHHSIPGGIWYITTGTGHRVSIPRYWKLKIFTEEEIISRSLLLADQPPSFSFKGIKYLTESQYLSAINYYHSRTLLLRVSDPRRIRFCDRISESIDFVL